MHDEFSNSFVSEWAGSEKKPLAIGLAFCRPTGTGPECMSGLKLGALQIIVALQPHKLIQVRAEEGPICAELQSKLPLALIQRLSVFWVSTSGWSWSTKFC